MNKSKLIKEVNEVFKDHLSWQGNLPPKEAVLARKRLEMLRATTQRLLNTLSPKLVDRISKQCGLRDKIL